MRTRCLAVRESASLGFPPSNARVASSTSNASTSALQMFLIGTRPRASLSWRALWTASQAAAVAQRTARARAFRFPARGKWQRRSNGFAPKMDAPPKSKAFEAPSSTRPRDGAKGRLNHLAPREIIGSQGVLFPSSRSRRAATGDRSRRSALVRKPKSRFTTEYTESTCRAEYLADLRVTIRDNTLREAISSNLRCLCRRHLGVRRLDAAFFPTVIPDS